VSGGVERPSQPDPRRRPFCRRGGRGGSRASGFKSLHRLFGLQASYADLIRAFATNQQAMQVYGPNEPNEGRIETFGGLDYIATTAT
jgi:hypothetical protein